MVQKLAVCTFVTLVPIGYIREHDSVLRRGYFVIGFNARKRLEPEFTYKAVMLGCIIQIVFELKPYIPEMRVAAALRG